VQEHSHCADPVQAIIGESGLQSSRGIVETAATLYRNGFGFLLSRYQFRRNASHNRLQKAKQNGAFSGPSFWHFQA
jgi:hypothetical protein